MGGTERRGGEGPRARSDSKGPKRPAASDGAAGQAGKAGSTHPPGSAHPPGSTHPPPHGRSPVEVLAKLDLFRDLAAAHLQRMVAAIGAEERHSRGSTIFEEGEKGDKFYLILDGAVRISRFVAGLGEEALAVLRPGAYFGEMSLIDDEARSAAAIAHESCHLFVIKRADLEDLLFVDRDLAYDFLWNLVRTLSRRLRATNDKMTFLASTNKF